MPSPVFSLSPLSFCGNSRRLLHCVWTHNASFACMQTHLCVGVRVGATGIILLDITPLCLSVRGCDYVLHYVGPNRLSPPCACARADVSHLLCALGRTDVLTRIERRVIYFKVQSVCQSSSLFYRHNKTHGWLYLVTSNIMKRTAYPSTGLQKKVNAYLIDLPKLWESGGVAIGFP